MTARIRIPILGVCLLLLFGWAVGASGVSRRAIPPGAPSEVKKQIARLCSNSVDDRVGGALALGRLGAKADAAVPFLQDLLGDTTRVSLTTVYKREGLQVFGFPTVGRIAADALWDIRPPAFLALLKHRDAAARRCAVEALAERGRGPAAMELLLHAAGDAHAKVRRAAAWGLHHLPTPRARAALLTASADPVPAVRMAAAFALGDMGTVDADGKATSRLIRMLQADIDKRCRGAAAWSLGKMTDRRAPAALRMAGRDRDPSVRYLARTALSPRTADAKKNAQVLLALWRDDGGPTRPPPPTRSQAALPSRRRARARPALASVDVPGGGAPAAFRLGGIMSGPSGRVAMINGRARSVGQSVDGAKVMRINAFSVELERNGDTFTIRR